MVEVGKKYRLKHWESGQWFLVKYVGNRYVTGDREDGREDFFCVDTDFVEIKQRPRTLADCHKAGEYGPRDVILKGRQRTFVEVRGAEKNDLRYGYCYEYYRGRLVPQRTGSELSDWLVWPIEMTEE